MGQTNGISVVAPHTCSFATSWEPDCLSGHPTSFFFFLNNNIFIFGRAVQLVGS